MWDENLKEYGRSPKRLIKIRAKNNGARIEVEDLIWRAVVRPDCSTIALIIEDKVQAFCVGLNHSSDLQAKIIKIKAQNMKDEIEE